MSSHIRSQTKLQNVNHQSNDDIVHNDWAIKANSLSCKPLDTSFKSEVFNNGKLRNHLIIALCIHTALRISDVLRLTTDDVYDFKNRCVRKNITITEKKTKKTKSIALNKSIVAILSACFPSAVPGAPLIRNRRTNKAIGRIQAYRIIRDAARALGFAQPVSCHSLRKTFGYHSWKMGTAVAVIMDIFNHSSLKVTQRYLGVSQDDRDAAYLGLSF